MTFLALLAAAAAVVGHPVDVRCVPASLWPDRVAAQIGPATRAYTWFDAGAPRFVVLSPDVCGYMALLAADPNDRRGSRLNGAGTRTREGEAALSFVHELEHVRLATRDEGAAECAALTGLPGVLARLGVRRPASLLAAAAALHYSKPAAYRTVC